jgi:hypothetical protein
MFCYVDDKTCLEGAIMNGLKLETGGRPVETAMGEFLKLLTEEQKNQMQAADNTKSGCFIATACYGCCDAPEVMALRQFRDECLLTSSIGRWLVERYYRVSPGIAKALLRHPFAANYVRRFVLDPLIALIPSCGAR